MRTYLLASLPSLFEDEPAPLTREEFDARCEAVLPLRECEELTLLSQTPPTGYTEFACAWRGVWNQMRNANDAMRAARLAEMPARLSLAVLPFQVSVKEGVEEAWQAHDPLQRERALMRVEWNWLEACRRAEPYGFPDLAGYALQLRILHRMEQWEADVGRAVFEEQVETLLNPITKNMFVQQEVGA